MHDTKPSLKIPSPSEIRAKRKDARAELLKKIEAAAAEHITELVLALESMPLDRNYTFFRIPPPVDISPLVGSPVLWSYIFEHLETLGYVLKHHDAGVMISLPCWESDDE